MSIPIMKRRISTYAPMQEGHKHIALISGIPMIFRGNTAIQAAKQAKAWRKEQVEKEERRIAKAERTAERMRKR